MRKLLLALALALLPSLAWAQNPTCPTRPTGDNSNACASTAFVTNMLVGGIPLTHNYFLVGNASNIGQGRLIVGADLPVPSTISLGGVFSSPATSTSVMSGISNAGAPQFQTVTGSAPPVVLQNAPTIVTPNITTGIYLNSFKLVDEDASYRYLYGFGALTNSNWILQWNQTNAYIKRDATAFTSSDGGTTFADISSGGWNFYASGGVFYHGSSSGTHHVVAAPAAGSGTSTWPSTTGTIINTGATNTVTNAMLSNMANSTIKCRTTAGTGAPEDCTGANVAAIATSQFLFTTVAIDFNTTNTDYPVTITLPTGYTKFILASIRTVNTGTTASLTTATYGVWTGAGETGTAIVTSGAVLSAITTNAPATNAAYVVSSLAVGGTAYFNSGTTFYYRMKTAQGAAASGTAIFQLIPIP